MIARRGQGYGVRSDDPRDDDLASKPARGVGLLFMAVVAGIEQQFEQLQRAANGEDGGPFDAVMGQRAQRASDAPNVDALAALGRRARAGQRARGRAGRRGSSAASTASCRASTSCGGSTMAERERLARDGDAMLGRVARARARGRSRSRSRCVIVGGYRLGWTWTGFSDNGTIWDWLAAAGAARRADAAAGLVPHAALAAHRVARRRRRRSGSPRSILDRRRLRVRLALHRVPRQDAVGLARSAGAAARPDAPADQPRVVLGHASARCASRSRLAGVALGLLVVAGYAFDWAWTGFRGNTFWDWLHLLLVPFLLPAAVTWLSARARETAARPGPSRTRTRERSE